MRFGCPFGYQWDDAERERLQLLGDVELTDRPAEAVAGAAFVHADTWVSMGQEADKQERKQAFEGFTVDGALMDAAAPDARFLHCLPGVPRPGGDGATSSTARAASSSSRATTASTAPAAAIAFLLGVRP